MPDLKWIASIDVTNVSKAITKIEKEAESLGVSFDKSFKTADEGISYFKESISSLESALVKLKKEQADIMSLPQSDERTARLKELKDEIDDVTNSLRQNKKWQTELSKAQREDLGNTQAQTSSFRGLFNTFKAGAKTTHSLTGGIKALSAAMKANPAGLVLLAVASLVKVFKGLYNTIQPLKNLVDGITDSFKKAYTAVVNFFGAETVAQHDSRIERLKRESDAIKDVKEKTEELKRANADFGKSDKQLLQDRNKELKKLIETENANQKKFKTRRVVDGSGNLIYSKDLSVEKIKQYNAEIALNETKIAGIIADEGKKADDAKQSAIEKYKQQLSQQLELQKSFGERLAESIEDAEQKRTLAGINAMNDGFAKRLALLKFNYEKENKSIDKYEKEQIDAYNKAYKTNYTSLDQLPEETRSNIASVVSNRKSSNEQSYTSAVEKEYQSVIDKYQSFTVQMKSINDKYAEEEKALRDKNTAESLASIEILKQKREEELESVYLSQREYAKKNSEVLKKAFGNTAITTKKQLEEAIGIVEKYRQILGADNEEDALKIGNALGLSEEETKNVIANGAQVAEEIQAIDDKLNGLKSQRTGLKKIADDFKALAKSAKEGGLDFTENLQAVLDFANGISNAVESIASYMNEIASISGDDKLARRAQSISNAVSVVNSTANGALRGAQLTGNGAGAVLGGVIGFSVSLIEKSSKANAENAKRATEMTEALKEYYRTLESAKLDSMFKDSIFGSGGFSNAISRIKTLEEEWENLNNGEYRHNLNGKGYTVYDERIQQFNKFLRLYGSIFDILDEKGNVIVENLRSLLDSGGVADNYKEGVEFALSYLEKIEEATNELNNELSNLFGSLGDNLAQSMFDAFAEGEDAGKAMFDTLDSLEKSFAKTLMKDFANKWLANNFGNDIDNIANMTSNEDVESSISSLLLNIRSLLPNLETGLKTIYDSFGFSESMSASSSTAKGIAQASQDSVDELNGRFTAIQSHTYSINESIKDMQSRQATILNEIMGIHRDTSSIDGRLRDGISVRLLR